MASQGRRVLRLNTFWEGAHLSPLGISWFLDAELKSSDVKKAWDHLRTCARCRLTVGRTAQMDRIAMAAWKRQLSRISCTPFPQPEGSSGCLSIQPPPRSR